MLMHTSLTKLYCLFLQHHEPFHKKHAVRTLHEAGQNRTVHQEKRTYAASRSKHQSARTIISIPAAVQQWYCREQFDFGQQGTVVLALDAISSDV